MEENLIKEKHEIQHTLLNVGQADDDLTSQLKQLEKEQKEITTKKNDLLSVETGNAIKKSAQIKQKVNEYHRFITKCNRDINTHINRIKKSKIRGDKNKANKIIALSKLRAEITNEKNNELCDFNQLKAALLNWKNMALDDSNSSKESPSCYQVLCSHRFLKFLTFFNRRKPPKSQQMIDDIFNTIDSRIPKNNVDTLQRQAPGNK